MATLSVKSSMEGTSKSLTPDARPLDNDCRRRWSCEDNETGSCSSTSTYYDSCEGVNCSMSLYMNAIEEAADTWETVRKIPDYELVVGKVLFRQ
jgi:hypothetical protein